MVQALVKRFTAWREEEAKKCAEAQVPSKPSKAKYQKMMKKRRYAAGEIFDTERKYVENMQLLCRIYITPLRRAGA